MPSGSKDTENQPFLQYYSDDPTVTDSAPDRRSQNQDRRRKLLSHSVVFVATSIFWLIALYIVSSPKAQWKSISYSTDDRHNITSNARLMTCGNTTQEAKAHGCKYDILLNTWVPAQCWDEEFILEYQDDDSWGAYADANLTQRLSIEEMSESESYWTSVRDHINHCGTMWKKQFWVLFEDRPVFDSMIASPGHTDHCAHYLMGVMDMKPTESTKVERGFADCWIRD